MKEILYIIERFNNGELLYNSLISTKWIIYSDLSIDIIKEYNNDKINKTINISNDEYDLIVSDIDKLNSSDRLIDGECFEIKKYNSDFKLNISYTKELDNILNIIDK